jgi:hypothetical protein
MQQEDPQAPPTEDQIVPPEEQILPTGGGTMPPPEAEVEEGPAAPDPVAGATGQAQSLAQENPMPLALAGAFLAGLVVGRILSR